MGTSSRKTLEDLLAQAQRLSEDDRRQLIADLQADKSAVSTETRRQNAMKRWLARAGSGHADATDVSAHKNEYLAESYATKS